MRLAALLAGLAIVLGGAPVMAQSAADPGPGAWYGQTDRVARADASPVWTGPAADPAQLKGLVTAIRASATHGLNPQDYHLAELEAVDSLRSDPAIDALATRACLSLAGHLLAGRFDPVRFEPDWTAPRRTRDLRAWLEQAMADGDIAASLDALAPDEPGYAALRNALLRHEAIVEAGGWPSIAEGPEMRPGDRGPRVAQLRARLEASGDLAPLPSPTEADGQASGASDLVTPDPASPDHTSPDPADSGPGDPEFFDAPLQAAVEAFQQASRLEIDGRVGSQTLHELNLSAGHRVSQIRANLERYRWLPADMGRRHIRVNIPDFSLEARHEGVVERRHDAIVGLSYRPTPVFSAEMTYIVVNPWWETPRSIAVRNELPLFRRDPGAVTRLGFQVLDRDGNVVDPAMIDWNTVSASDFPYRLRQAPGPLNALGEVKLIFPNRHNVYLHDTSNRELFAHNRRCYSSGCVRLRDPFELADWVIAETPELTPEGLREIAAGNTETRLPLARPIPVYILYWTAVHDPSTGIRFIADLYQRDDELIAALEATPSSME
ncbi:L,D-transpeptidase family protein [Maricaulis salignorans]|uniref:L,D-transpeptidase family protein n=1 Tax=Maricaulis salignorans TaxID=144026 RepID=UPI003A8DF33C